MNISKGHDIIRECGQGTRYYLDPSPSSTMCPTNEQGQASVVRCLGPEISVGYRDEYFFLTALSYRGFPEKFELKEKGDRNKGHYSHLSLDILAGLECQT